VVLELVANDLATLFTARRSLRRARCNEETFQMDTYMEAEATPLLNRAMESEALPRIPNRSHAMNPSRVENGFRSFEARRAHARDRLCS
jgi:hypothetical protein